MTEDWSLETLIEKLTQEEILKEEKIFGTGFYGKYLMSYDEYIYNIRKRIRKKLNNAIRKSFGVKDFCYDADKYADEQKDAFLRWYLSLEECEEIDLKRKGNLNRKILSNIQKGRPEDNYWELVKNCIEMGNKSFGFDVKMDYPNATEIEQKWIQLLAENQTSFGEKYLILMSYIRDACDVFADSGDKIECYMMCGILNEVMYYWYRHVLKDDITIRQWYEICEKELSEWCDIQFTIKGERKATSVNIFEDYALGILVTAHKNEIEAKKRALEKISLQTIDVSNFNTISRKYLLKDPEDIPVIERKKYVLGEHKERTSRFLEKCRILKNAYRYLIESQYFYESEWTLFTEKVFYEAVYGEKHKEFDESEAGYKKIIRNIIDGKYKDFDDLHMDLLYLREQLTKIIIINLEGEVAYKKYIALKKSLLKTEERILNSRGDDKVEPYEMLKAYRNAILTVPQEMLDCL